ncbi:MAG: M48 family metallopeptidase [Cytophagales bacterium]|nr:M48 family metallopeptidase [Cytophagales bacterium]
MKTLFKGLSIAATFLMLWFGLMQVNWMSVFGIDENTIDLEEKLGDLLYENMQDEYGELEDSLTNKVMEDLMMHLLEENGINPKKVKLHVMDADYVNALTLPDGHILLFTGLVDQAEDQFTVAGVLAHELGHVQERHVMKSLIKEIGLSVLLTMTTGDQGPVVFQQVSEMLTSSALDREMEREADEKAIIYLNRAGISSENLANFFYELSLEEDDLMKQLSWISTHPDLEERAKAMLESEENWVDESTPVINQEPWDQVLEKIRRN